MQAMDGSIRKWWSSHKYALRVVDPLSSKDLAVVIDFHRFTDCHLEVIFDVNMHRNLSWNLFTVDGKNVHRQFLSEPGSVRYFSTLPLTTVWSSNYQTLFFDFFEVCITKMVTLSPNVQTFLLISLTLYFQITWSVILHSDWSIASQLTLLWP